jgi:hypothetical protein
MQDKVVQIIYLKTRPTTQNSITFTMKVREYLNSGNAYCHPVQNLSPTRPLFKTQKLKLTIILPLALYGYATGPLKLIEHKLRVFRRIFGLKRYEVTGEYENYIIMSFIICTLLNAYNTEFP